MAKKFNGIELGRLRNYEFVDLNTELKSAVSTRAAYLPPPVVTCFNQSFLPAYQRLDEGIQKISKSALTEQIHDADRERDDAYMGMVNAKNSALTHFNPQTREQARRMDVLFDAYGNLAKKPLYAETAGVENFLQDLRGPAYAEDAEALGLLEWAAHLENRNFAVRNLLRQRDNETADKTDVVVKEARAALVGAYGELTALIEAFILLGMGQAENLAMAESLVEVFNVVIDRFNRLIARRKRKPGAAAQEEDGGDEQDDGQEGGEQGE